LNYHLQKRVQNTDIMCKCLWMFAV